MINEIPPVTFEISSEAQCRGCEKDIPFDTKSCPHCDAFNLFIDIGDYLARYVDRQFMDVRFGGYVIGRTTVDDDIPMFQFWGKNILNCMGLMQGQEYVLCPEATSKHHGLLEEINSEKGDVNSLPEITLTPSSNVIDVRLCNPLNGIWEYGGVLINPQQFIINRFATRKHFETLERINSEAQF